MSYDEMALIAELAAELGLADRRPPVRRVEHRRGGATISALRWGDDEPRLVLVHGGGLNAHSWDAVLLHLGVPALAIDLPGHGRSSWFDEPLYLPERLADALAPAVAALAPGAQAVAGHSLGGLGTLALAARFPELVERLVLVDATPGSTPERSEAILSFVAQDEFDSFEAILAHAGGGRAAEGEGLRRAVLHNAHETGDGRWRWRHDTRPHPTGDRWAILFEELPKGWDHAAALTCPLLLVRGGRSRILPAEDVERYRELVADLTVTEIAGAGHNVHRDAPEALATAIGRFLG